MKIKKLKKVNFYDIYGIFLIANKKTDQRDLSFLAYMLNEVAKKYFNISKCAVLDELSHFPRGCASDEHACPSNDMSQGEVINHNKYLLKKLDIKNWIKDRTSISLNDAIFLFSVGVWDVEYGGKAWCDIAREVKKLGNKLPVTADNLTKVISIIDTLNALEHNNSYYMWEYCNFDLLTALNIKAKCDEDSLIRRCSKEVRDMYRDSKTTFSLHS